MAVLFNSKDAYALAQLRADRDKRPYVVSYTRGRYLVYRTTIKRWLTGLIPGMTVFPEGMAKRIVAKYKV